MGRGARESTWEAAHVRAARPLVVGSALFAIIALSSCGSSSRQTERLRVDVDSLKALIQGVDESMRAEREKHLYVLSDVARDNLTVAAIRSDRSIGVGERIFLGEDMWDVIYVKVSTTPTVVDRAFRGNPPTYETSGCELLVRFAGKGSPRATS